MIRAKIDDVIDTITSNPDGGYIGAEAETFLDELRDWVKEWGAHACAECPTKNAKIAELSGLVFDAAEARQTALVEAMRARRDLHELVEALRLELATVSRERDLLALHLQEVRKTVNHA